MRHDRELHSDITDPDAGRVRLPPDFCPVIDGQSSFFEQPHPVLGFIEPVKFRRSTPLISRGIERARDLKLTALDFFDAKVAATFNGGLQKAGRTVSSAIDKARYALTKEKRELRDFWRHHHPGRNKVAAFAGALGGITLADALFAPNAAEVVQRSMLQGAGHAGKAVFVIVAACYTLSLVARSQSDAMRPSVVAGLCAVGAAGARYVIG